MDAPVRFDQDAKNRYEQAWLDYLMGRSLDWHKFRSTHKMYIHESQPLVVWEYSGDSPQVQRILRLYDVDLALGAGLKLRLQDTATSEMFDVGSTPKEVFPGVFLWTPAFCDLRFAPHHYDTPSSRRRLTVPLCCKTRSRSDEPQEGHQYILTLKSFSALWPTDN